MSFLTRNRDTVFYILSKLDDVDLVNVFQTNKEAYKYFKDQQFWLNRILTKFPYLSLTILTLHKRERSWSDYYIHDLRLINPDTSFLYLNSCRLDLVMVAVNNNAGVHTADEFAVKYASGCGHLEIVKYLVSQGANIHADNDCTVRWASSGGHLEVVKYLVSQGADIHAENDFAVRMACLGGHSDVIKYLVSLGAPDPRI